MIGITNEQQNNMWKHQKRSHQMSVFDRRSKKKAPGEPEAFCYYAFSKKHRYKSTMSETRNRIIPGKKFLIARFLGLDNPSCCSSLRLIYDRQAACEHPWKATENSNERRRAVYTRISIFGARDILRQISPSITTNWTTTIITSKIPYLKIRAKPSKTSA